MHSRSLHYHINRDNLTLELPFVHSYSPPIPGNCKVSGNYNRYISIHQYTLSARTLIHEYTRKSRLIAARSTNTNMDSDPPRPPCARLPQSFFRKISYITHVMSAENTIPAAQLSSTFAAKGKVFARGVAREKDGSAAAQYIVTPRRMDSSIAQFHAFLARTLRARASMDFQQFSAEARSSLL